MPYNQKYIKEAGVGPYLKKLTLIIDSDWSTDPLQRDPPFWPKLTKIFSCYFALTQRDFVPFFYLHVLFCFVMSRSKNNKWIFSSSKALYTYYEARLFACNLITSTFQLLNLPSKLFNYADNWTLPLCTLISPYQALLSNQC